MRFSGTYCIKSKNHRGKFYSVTKLALIITLFFFSSKNFQGIFVIYMLPWPHEQKDVGCDLL